MSLFKIFQDYQVLTSIVEKLVGIKVVFILLYKKVLLLIEPICKPFLITKF